MWSFVSSPWSDVTERQLWTRVIDCDLDSGDGGNGSGLVVDGNNTGKDQLSMSDNSTFGFSEVHL